VLDPFPDDPIDEEGSITTEHRWCYILKSGQAWACGNTVAEALHNLISEFGPLWTRKHGQQVYKFSRATHITIYHDTGNIEPEDGVEYELVYYGQDDKISQN
jgi:hypothetical protein